MRFTILFVFGLSILSLAGVGAYTLAGRAVLKSYGLDECAARAYAEVKNNGDLGRFAPPAKPQQAGE